MKVTLIQTELVWQSPQENRKKIERLIESSPGADLFILPEMFTTGFVTSPKGVAEPEGGAQTLGWMKRTASSKGAAVAGSVSVEENGRYYNRLFFVKPDGTYAKYDKRHLFSFAGEDREYTAGDERVVVEYLGVRILLLVCYDLRFPVWSRSVGDYDMIICVANWPVPRVKAWETLLRARAIENLCYVAGVNRVGSDPFVEYSGSTVLLDFLGEPAAESETGKEGVITGDVELEKLAAFRERFPALDDADAFNITI